MRETTEAPKHEGVDLRGSGSGRGRFAPGTPEDVAALYTWANILGARYRDFSGSRVRYREQVRAQAAEVLRVRSLGGVEEELTEGAVEEKKDSAEHSAAPVDRPSVAFGDAGSGGVPVVRAGSGTGSAVRSGSRRVLGAERGGRIEEELVSTDQVSFRKEPVPRGGAQLAVQQGSSLESGRLREGPERVRGATSRVHGLERESAGTVRDSASVSLPHSLGGSDAEGLSQKGSAEERHISPSDDPGDMWARDSWERVGEGRRELPAVAEMRRRPVAPISSGGRQDRERGVPSGGARAWNSLPALDPFARDDGGEDEYAGPAWLYGGEFGVRSSRSVAAAAGQRTGHERVPDSRAPAGPRWSALQAVMDQGRGSMRQAEHDVTADVRAPLLVVLSLAGGVGKTSVVATLGRVLSASGERVALGDTAACSPLPFFFGAHDVRPGAKRIFAPPEGSKDAPIFVANYDLSGGWGDTSQQRHVVADILRNSSECNRILLDLPAGADWLVRRMVTLGSTVVVPLAPDMNSVIGLEAAEQYFEQMVDSEGNAVLPFYLLNGFDGSLPLHIDVRDALRRHLGERLLRAAIRRSPLVSEALAEGMTVVDYAPESPAARDYGDLAAWLRGVSPAAMAGMRSLRSSAQ